MDKKKELLDEELDNVTGGRLFETIDPEEILKRYGQISDKMDQLLVQPAMAVAVMDKKDKE